jgi:hypothetical protein
MEDMRAPDLAISKNQFGAGGELVMNFPMIEIADIVPNSGLQMGLRFIQRVEDANDIASQ